MTVHFTVTPLVTGSSPLAAPTANSLVALFSAPGDPLWIPGAFPFRTAQPGELGIQQVDGFGGGLLWYRGSRLGFRRCRDEGAAGALVAGVGPAAGGAQSAQLFW